MDKKIAVRCECEGTGFIAVQDRGGDGVDYVECAEHNPAYKPDYTVMGIFAELEKSVKELERLTIMDPMDFLGRKN